MAKGACGETVSTEDLEAGTAVYMDDEKFEVTSVMSCGNYFVVGLATEHGQYEEIEVVAEDQAELMWERG